MPCLLCVADEIVYAPVADIVLLLSLKSLESYISVGLLRDTFTSLGNPFAPTTVALPNVTPDVDVVPSYVLTAL